MLRMLPIQLFTMLRTELGTTIPRIRDAYSFAALQADKLPYCRRMGGAFQPVVIDAMVIGIPPTGIAAIPWGNAGGRKFLATNSTFHTNTTMLLSFRTA